VLAAIEKRFNPGSPLYPEQMPQRVHLRQELNLRSVFDVDEGALTSKELRTLHKLLGTDDGRSIVLAIKCRVGARAGLKRQNDADWMALR